MAKNPAGTAKPRKPKGAELNWTQERTYALAAAVASGVSSTRDLIAALAANESFAGVPADAITAPKITRRLGQLRKAGVPIPVTGRGRGRSEVDVAQLSALFG